MFVAVRDRFCNGAIIIPIYQLYRPEMVEVVAM